MAYQQYGVPRDLVERVKMKLKHPAAKDRVKQILHGVTKHDLQDKAKVKKLLDTVSGTLGEKLSDQQSASIVRFVLAQKIDPNNTFHLIRLWNMFR